ncbi:MAG: hypothetical protein KGH71_05800 [Candidatus Micrarchaeota archaeon]|nr:hypothetical protein [Candidatus Micrarchaeota archaeon]
MQKSNVNADIKSYSDGELRKIRKELTPLQEQILKALYTNPIYTRDTLSLENEVVKQVNYLKIIEVKEAINVLRDKKLLKTDGIVSVSMTSLTINGIYLFLVTELRKDVTVKTFQS